MFLIFFNMPADYFWKYSIWLRPKSPISNSGQGKKISVFLPLALIIDFGFD